MILWRQFFVSIIEKVGLAFKLRLNWDSEILILLKFPNSGPFFWFLQWVISHKKTNKWSDISWIIVENACGIQSIYVGQKVLLFFSILYAWGWFHHAIGDVTTAAIKPFFLRLGLALRHQRNSKIAIESLVCVAGFCKRNVSRDLTQFYIIVR